MANLGETLKVLYDEYLEWEYREWSTYLDTIECRFPAKRVGSKFYTLDGKKELMDSTYIKWSEHECLTKEEKAFLVQSEFKE